MVTLRKYMVLAQAERDRSLLEAAEIPVFLADECSAVSGYASVLGEIRLQVEQEDVDRARRVLDQHEGFMPLPDDFVPPEEPPAAPSKAGGAFVWGGTFLALAFCVAAALFAVTGGVVYSPIAGLVLLVVAWVLVGFAVGAIYRKGPTNGPTLPGG
jgi:hypothetical protein